MPRVMYKVLSPNRKRIRQAGIFGLAMSIMLSVITYGQQLRPVLSAETAKRIVAGCELFAREHGLRVAIAVAGPGDELVAFLRVDGAVPGAGEFAIWKAKSSASLGLATAQLAELAKATPALLDAPGVAPVAGGEAVYSPDGDLLGGVGVSGASENNDVNCARSGIKNASQLTEKIGNSGG